MASLTRLDPRLPSFLVYVEKIRYPVNETDVDWWYIKVICACIWEHTYYTGFHLNGAPSQEAYPILTLLPNYIVSLSLA